MVASWLFKIAKRSMRKRQDQYEEEFETVMALEMTRINFPS